MSLGSCVAANLPLKQRKSNIQAVNWSVNLENGNSLQSKIAGPDSGRSKYCAVRL